MCVSYHINQLGDLQSEAYSNRAVGVLDGPDPALVALEKVPQQKVLHLCQGHKLTLTWNTKKTLWIRYSSLQYFLMFIPSSLLSFSLKHPCHGLFFEFSHFLFYFVGFSLMYLFVIFTSCLFCCVHLCLVS